MKESVTYQAIVEEGVVQGRVQGRLEGRLEGRLQGEQSILLRMGRKRLGEPSPAVLARVEAIQAEATLATLADRLLDVSSWDELLSGL